ncbi:MAG: hypothetical protein ACFFFY_04365 [Promethearchaeota archaeon]
MKVRILEMGYSIFIIIESKNYRRYIDYDKEKNFILFDVKNDFKRRKSYVKIQNKRVDRK